jgi:hypothetical protein
MPDVWLSPDAYGSADPSEYRFGTLLSTGDPAGPAPEISTDGYGILVGQGSRVMNAGMLPLTYKLWAANNPDDPANMLAGLQPSPSSKPPVDVNWDFDGRIVLTAEVFSPTDTSRPVAVRSMLLGPAGAEVVERYGDSQQETGESTHNTGYKGGAVVDLSDYTGGP